MLCLVVTAVVLLSNGVFSPVDGANILGLMGVPSPSHHIWNSVLMHKLAEKGHNVTVLSVDLPKESEKLPPNLHYIYLEEGYGMYAREDSLDINTFIGVGPYEVIPMFHEYGYDSCYYSLKSKGIQVLLNYPDNFKFDVIVHDYTVQSCLLGFLHKFKYPPLVGISAYHNPPNTIDAMANHIYPAYVPHHLTPYAPEMNFWERLLNTCLFTYEIMYRRWLFHPRINALMKAHFPEDTPDMEDLMGHTTIALVNSHPAINFVESVPPNVIEVGGMQILDPKPLPRDLEMFMNSSRNGVILVSFGTNMKSEFFSQEKIDVIVNAFAQLPQYDFLWKFEEKYLKRKLPSNVRVKSFLPQRDLLAHPKLKAFVTHCGGLSTQEALWRAVPMVGVPLFVDQHRNNRLSLRAGVAKQLDFLTMTSEELRDTIITVAEDPTLRKNANTKAAQFRDRPMRALDTAVWWVEYLIRNPNPSHLKSPAARLNIFQRNSLDTLVVILIALLSGIYVVLKVVFMGWKAFSGMKNESTKKKMD